jgi:hypothetical protein
MCLKALHPGAEAFDDLVGAAEEDHAVGGEPPSGDFVA